MIDVRETQDSQRERGRVTAQGRRTDDNSGCTLLVIHEAGSSWAIHGLPVSAVLMATSLHDEPSGRILHVLRPLERPVSLQHPGETIPERARS